MSAMQVAQNFYRRSNWPGIGDAVEIGGNVEHDGCAELRIADRRRQMSPV